MKCDHEYNEFIKVYSFGLPNTNVASKIVVGVPIMGPQAYYQRTCLKCGMIEIVCGNDIENYMINNHKQKTLKK